MIKSKNKVKDTVGSVADMVGRSVSKGDFAA